MQPGLIALIIVVMLLVVTMIVLLSVAAVDLDKEGTLFYLGTVDPKLNFVVAPWQTDPSHVCAQYCATGPTAGVCEGPIYGGKSAQENYDTCLQTLITNFSDQCFPPAPIAAKGVSEYYAYAVTEKACVTK